MLLNEQLTSATLRDIEGKAQLGPKASEQLTILAAESALKVPPAKELPALAAPDVTAQREIADRAFTYIDQAVNHLPDFLATRVTISFDDKPWISRRGTSRRLPCTLSRDAPGDFVQGPSGISAAIRIPARCCKILLLPGASSAQS